MRHATQNGTKRLHSLRRGFCKHNTPKGSPETKREAKKVQSISQSKRPDRFWQDVGLFYQQEKPKFVKRSQKKLYNQPINTTQHKRKSPLHLINQLHHHHHSIISIVKLYHEVHQCILSLGLCHQSWDDSSRLRRVSTSASSFQVLSNSQVLQHH